MQKESKLKITWDAIKSDKELRPLQVWLIVFGVIAHLILRQEHASVFAHLVLGATQIVCAATMLGCSLKSLTIMAHESLGKVMKDYISQLEDHVEKYKAYTSHLEKTNEALRGNVEENIESHADGVLIN